MTMLATDTTGRLERIRALVAAHRRAQAELRAALAIESERALSAANRISQTIVAALQGCGAGELADQLVREAAAGTALLIAMTSDDDVDPNEIPMAIAAYLQHRAVVERAVEQHSRDRGEDG